MGIGPGSFGHFGALGFEALGLCGALEEFGPKLLKFKGPGVEFRVVGFRGCLMVIDDGYVI